MAGSHNTAPLYFHQAQAAAAIHGKLGMVAQCRKINSCFAHDCQDRLLAVQLNTLVVHRDPTHAVTSIAWNLQLSTHAPQRRHLV